MIKLELVEVNNFEGAFRGLRNPMNSWNKSDSKFGIASIYDDDILDLSSEVSYSYWSEPENDEEYSIYETKVEKTREFLLENGNSNFFPSKGNYSTYVFLGKNDIDLARKMVVAGTDESKFLRQIFVTMDIIAPLYW